MGSQKAKHGGRSIPGGTPRWPTVPSLAAYAFPSAPGTYVLQLRLRRSTTIAVGALGRICFAAGSYFYIGSALGRGGLRGRLQHHVRPIERPHWHIDYLRRHATVENIYTAPGSVRGECVWTRRLASTAGLLQVVDGFGASDCRCFSHLFCVRPPFVPVLSVDFFSAFRRSYTARSPRTTGS
jgi:Uri superfamily endonuclease